MSQVPTVNFSECMYVKYFRWDFKLSRAQKEKIRAVEARMNNPLRTSSLF
jgi:hypothetical protein